MESYDLTAKTVRLKRVEDGHTFTVPFDRLSKADNDFIEDLAAVPKLASAEDVKAYWLAYQRLDPNGSPKVYQGKAGRLLAEFKTSVRAGDYDLEAQLEALTWNAAEYRRVADLKNAATTDAKRAEVTLLKEQRDLQRRELAAKEAAAAASQEMALQLEDIRRELWKLRNGW